jgi:uncharacterized protein (DUF302 family)
MPNRIDTFESIFRRANKPIFRFSPPKVEKILLMSDLSGHHAQRFEERVRRFVETGYPGGRITWESVHGEKPDTREAFLKSVEACAPDLIVTHRNLYDDLRDPNFGMGIYVLVLTQSTDVPVMVVPRLWDKGFEKATEKLEDVILVTDGLVRVDRLVNWAVHFVNNSGTLFFTNVESQVAFDRYMVAISRIPDIETELAEREIRRELLKEAEDYIRRCQEVLAAVKPNLQTEVLVTMGDPLLTYRELLKQYPCEMLVMESKDERQIAMRGLAYTMAVEFSDTVMLLI